MIGRNPSRTHRGAYAHFLLFGGGGGWGEVWEFECSRRQTPDYQPMSGNSVVL